MVFYITMISLFLKKRQTEPEQERQNPGHPCCQLEVLNKDIDRHTVSPIPNIDIVAQ